MAGTNDFDAMATSVTKELVSDLNPSHIDKYNAELKKSQDEINGNLMYSAVMVAILLVGAFIAQIIGSVNARQRHDEI